MGTNFFTSPSSPGAVLQKTISISAAELIASDVSTKVLLPAAGAGKINWPIYVFCQLKVGGVLFNAPAGYSFEIGDANGNMTWMLGDNSFLNAAVNKLLTEALPQNGGFAKLNNQSDFENVDLVLRPTGLGNNPTLGNGSVVVNILYMQVSV